ARNWMSRGGNNLQSIFFGQRGDDATETADVRAGFLNVLADAGADFDLRLDHFRLDLLAKQHAAFFENLGDVRTQLARLWIDDLKFFFNTECELVEHLRI